MTEIGGGEQKIPVDSVKEDVVEINDAGDEDGSPAKTTNNVKDLLKDPEAMSALQQHFQRIISKSGGGSPFIPQPMSKEVKRRVCALKNLQFKRCEIEAEFFKEVHDLEKKYISRYDVLFDKARDVVEGLIEPADNEVEWESDDDDEDEKSKLTEVDDADGKSPKTEEDTVLGVPEFWLTAFKNSFLISDMVQECDLPVLKKLMDIRVTYDAVKENLETPNFGLEFRFSENEFFTNKTLVKYYVMKYEPEKTTDGLVNYEGPEFKLTVGCDIDWKQGKNLTQKTIKKKQKNKKKGEIRTVTKTVPNDTFFNFFNPPEEQGDTDSQDNDTDELLMSDFEVGQFFRERLVPKAVLYYTGDALDDDDDDEDDEYDEDNSEDNDADGDDEHDSVVDDGQPQKDCKQQ